MHKKYHEKFKILEILAVTTQAHEGLKRFFRPVMIVSSAIVTTQAHEGIETDQMLISPRLPCEHPVPVPGKKT